MTTEFASDSTLSISKTKPWHQRARVSEPPANFPALLKATAATLDMAALSTPCVLASSLSAEDMVLFHLIAREHLPIHTFALDTERLPEATLALWLDAEAHYGREIERVRPTAERLRVLGEMQDDSAIFESKKARELCCTVRKTEPLRRALEGKTAWITGLRKAQSAGRALVPHREWDVCFGLHKFNPLADWSDEALWYFIDYERIPVSVLYNNGYTSIGCDPCSRPIRFNEHPRAGRWWWEKAAAGDGSATECGIHIVSPTKSNAESTQPIIGVTE